MIQEILQMVQYQRKIKWALAILIIMMIGGCQTAPPELKAGLVIDKPYLIDDFTLTNQDNETVDNTDFRGSYVLVYFGFTNCPEACPTTLGIWKEVYTMLGDDGGGVEFVMISVDPMRDTPEQLKSYLANFHPSFVGLTGTMEDIEDIAADFSAYFREVYSDDIDLNTGMNEEIDEGMNSSHGDYLVSHTTLTFLLDKEGRLVLAFPYNTSAEEIVADLERFLD